MLNNTFALDFFTSLDNVKEWTRMNTFVIGKLTGGACITKIAAPKRSSSTAHLLTIANREHVSRLLYALRMIFYSSNKKKREQFDVLLRFLEPNSQKY